jgi:hypothetical protein
MPVGLRVPCLWRFSELLLVVMAVSAAVCVASFVDDCLERGIPVTGVTYGEDLLTVRMEGTLAMGDSLLKHYGGLFFVVADSIAAGWPVVGLQVDITGASLILFREDVWQAVEKMQQGLDEQVLAGWILEHTWVSRTGL